MQEYDQQCAILHIHVSEYTATFGSRKYTYGRRRSQHFAHSTGIDRKHCGEQQYQYRHHDELRLPGLNKVHCPERRDEKDYRETEDDGEGPLSTERDIERVDFGNAARYTVAVRGDE